MNEQMLRLNKNIKIFFNYFLGPLLFIWLSLSIYHQISNQPRLEESWQKIKQAIQGAQSWMFWVVLILMVVNWGVEARKWQVLLKPVEKISLLKAFKATLAGVAFAINLPNRIAEYGGRILYLQEQNRSKAVALTLVGSMSQFMITLLTGCGGLIFLLNIPESAILRMPAGFNLYWIRVILYIVIFLLFIGLVIYFQISRLIKIIEKLPAFSKLMRHISVLESVHFSLLLRILSLSFTRYMVFISQYVLMMRFLNVGVSVWQAFWLTTVSFLIMAVFPTIALAEIGIRGKVSIALFGLFSTNSIGIVTAAVGIWAINLVIPALTGSLLILRIKIFSNK